VLYPLWTAKPGSGCSTTALLFAAHLARLHGDALLVDLAGDLSVVAGTDPAAAGVTDWLASDAEVAALAALESTLSPRLALLPRGGADAWADARGVDLVAAWVASVRPVVVDVSTLDPGDRSPLQRLRAAFVASDPSVLVTRPCYVALRRALALPVRPTGVVLLREPGRRFDRHVVAATLGVPVVALIDQHPAVARAVDDGRIVRRPPRVATRQVAAIGR